MAGLLTQIKAFGLTLILGIITGSIFQYYQLTIRNARPGKYSLYLLDFILWIFLILVVFVCMLWINQGEMRIYVLIALMAGVLIYHRFLRQRLMLPLTRAAQITASAAESVRGLLQKLCIALKSCIKKHKQNPPPSDPVE